jgi:RNA polymerase sigma-70 factor (ECF subfamily)
MQQSENDLSAEFLNGNENSFEMLFKLHYESLCRYAYSFLNDKDEAEDVVQNTFVNVWQKRESILIQSSLKSYLFGMVRNGCLNKLKHEKVKSDYAAFSVIPEATHEASTASLATSNELALMINNAIDSLPEQCRLVFKLSRFENMKYAEIAKHLNISEKTVENQMGKALRVMREHLKEYLVWVVVFLMY